MARKNLLANVTAPETPAPLGDSRFDYARRGASRSMIQSIDEMAEIAKKMMASDAIVSLDTALIDGSFLKDRIEDDEEPYAQLRDAIRQHGQASPILVRPHPDQSGRYMIVFGHRRARVARDLGIPVLAVVKTLEDIAHVVAQGQENSARANLTFIEKALFAKKLREIGQGKETITSALSIDDTLLSRMLSVVEVLPVEVLDAMGAARSIGRDRWEEMKKLLIAPNVSTLAIEFVRTDEFQSKGISERFEFLLAHLKQAKRVPRKRAQIEPRPSTWTSGDNSVAARFHSSPKSFNLALGSKDAREFGYFISSNLDSLYRAFKETKTVSEAGD